MFGTLLAAPVGFLAVPAHASLAFDAHLIRASDTRNIVVADEVEDKAQGKVNEIEYGNGRRERRRGKAPRA